MLNSVPQRGQVFTLRLLSVEPAFFARAEFDFEGSSTGFDGDDARAVEFVRQLDAAAHLALREVGVGQAGGVTNDSRRRPTAGDLPEEPLVRTKEHVAHPQQALVPDVERDLTRAKDATARGNESIRKEICMRG